MAEGRCDASFAIRDAQCAMRNPQETCRRACRTSKVEDRRFNPRCAMRKRRADESVERRKSKVATGNGQRTMRVAVVGGGIAGASAAYELAGSTEVVLLERETVCGYHSTGRSAALFTECYGDPVVRRLAIASRGFLGDPPAGFTDTPILHPRSTLFVGTESQHGALQHSLDEFRSLVPSVRGISGDEAVAMCSVLDKNMIVGGVFEPGAQDIDVHALHLGYQQGVRRRGGRIVTEAEVTGLHRIGGNWEVR